MRNKIILPIFCFFLFSYLNQACAQVIDTSDFPAIRKGYDRQIQLYLAKSHSQKTTAWLLLGGGAAASVLGSAIASNSNMDNYTAGETIATLGGIAELISIPVFFASSKNKNRANQITFQKNIDLAESDAEREKWTQEAAFYFRERAAANRIPAIVLSAAGAGFIIGGIAAHRRGSEDPFTAIVDNAASYTLIAAGITTGLLSIPFYVRASSHKNTMERILRGGKVWNPELSLIPMLSYGNRQIGLAENIRF